MTLTPGEKEALRFIRLLASIARRLGWKDLQKTGACGKVDFIERKDGALICTIYPKRNLKLTAEGPEQVDPIFAIADREVSDEIARQAALWRRITSDE